MFPDRSASLKGRVAVVSLNGIDHVIVNGTSIVTDGKLTGETPGTLFRAGRDTYTVEAGTYSP